MKAVEEVKEAIKEEVKVVKEALTANQQHKESMSLGERLGLTVTKKVGTFYFFCGIVTWVILWLGYNLLPGVPHFDPGPAFVLWLILSNIIQLSLMPLLLVGQNTISRHQEIKADIDHETLQQIKKINDQQLQILHNQDEVLAELRRKNQIQDAEIDRK